MAPARAAPPVFRTIGSNRRRDRRLSGLSSLPGPSSPDAALRALGTPSATPSATCRPARPARLGRPSDVPPSATCVRPVARLAHLRVVLQATLLPPLPYPSRPCPSPCRPPLPARALYPPPGGTLPPSDPRSSGDLPPLRPAVPLLTLPSPPPSHTMPRPAGTVPSWPSAEPSKGPSLQSHPPTRPVPRTPSRRQPPPAPPRTARHTTPSPCQAPPTQGPPCRTARDQPLRATRAPARTASPDRARLRLARVDAPPGGLLLRTPPLIPQTPPLEPCAYLLGVFAVSAPAMLPPPPLWTPTG